jgi:DNA repair protein RecO (recombination protein O)
VLDLHEGRFVASRPQHPNYLEDALSAFSSQVLKTQHPSELTELQMNRVQRKILLEAFLSFYTFHQPGFGNLKSIPVLHALYEV